MSDLMLDIGMWVILITVIALCIILLFISVYGIYDIITYKKELKKYTIHYKINGIHGFHFVEAKNETQAIKKFRNINHICDIRETKINGEEV